MAPQATVRSQMHCWPHLQIMHAESNQVLLLVKSGYFWHKDYAILAIWRRVTLLEVLIASEAGKTKCGPCMLKPIRQHSVQFTDSLVCHRVVVKTLSTCALMHVGFDQHHRLTANPRAEPAQVLSLMSLDSMQCSLAIVSRSTSQRSMLNIAPLQQGCTAKFN